MTIRRQNERGFALLMVFAMAAAIAVMLYLEMPRVAFEHQRGKEALLVDRGEQYMRAIQMYHKKFNKLPQTLDDLDSTGNQRFLRRRYKDPMTGQDEWRLVHTDASGQYMDSLVHKRQDQKEKSGPSILSSNIVGIGESAQYVPQAGEKVTAAQQKRASDRIIPGGPGSTPAAMDIDQPGTESTAPQPRGPQEAGAPLLGGPPVAAQPSTGSNPFQTPGTPQSGSQQAIGGANQGANAQAGGVNGQQVNPNGVQGSGQAGASTGFGFGGGFGNSASTQTGQTGNRSGSTGFGQSGSSQSSGGFGQSGFGQRPGGTGQSSFGQSSFGQSGQSQGGFGQSSFGQSGQSQGGFGQSSFGQGGFGGNSGTPNSALGAIQNSLRNTGQGGVQQGGNMMGMGTGLGAGIVGVASKKEAEGILVYKERTNYTEWEFLFDPKAMAQAGQGGVMGQGQQGQGQGQNRGNSGGFGGMGSSGNSGFGGFGSSSGSSGSGFGGFGGSSGSSSGSGFGGFGGSSGSSGSGSGFGFGGSGSSGSQPRPAPGGFGRQ